MIERNRMNSGRVRILLIQNDAHAHTWLGCAGHPDLKTRHLDRLAEDSVRFTRAYACGGVCVPSRASLITGRPIIAHGVINNHCELPIAEQTMGRLLLNAGIETGYFGKGYYGHRHRTLVDEGWVESFNGRDYNEYLKDLGEGFTYPGNQIARNRVSRYWKAGPSAIPCEHFFEKVLADRAIEFIGRNSNNDFICFINNVAPHDPFTPPLPYADYYDPASLTLPVRSDSELQGKPEAFRRWVLQNQKYMSEDDLRIIIAQQYGLVHMVDDQIGRIIDFLKERDLYDSTLIVFTSDHGDYGGHYGIIGKSWCMDDCLLRIPLLVKVPGMNQGGEVLSELVQNHDILPTFLDYLGLMSPARIQGESLLPLLRGAGSGRKAVFAYMNNEYSEDSLTQCMVCDGRWKYIHSSSAEPQLFDLELDPFEHHNLAGLVCHENRILSMRDQLLGWFLNCSGQFYDSESAGYWEDETAFYDENLFSGERIQKRVDQIPVNFPDTSRRYV